VSKNQSYVVIDIEASSLGEESYPIEIAWGNDQDNITSFLINPNYVDDWLDWSVESERIHKISKGQLKKEGIKPREAYQKVKALFGKFDVYSDAPDYDSRWLYALNMACDDNYSYRIYPVSDLINKGFTDRGEIPPDPYSVLDKAYSESKKRHRAAEDVKSILRAISLSHNL